METNNSARSSQKATDDTSVSITLESIVDTDHISGPVGASLSNGKVKDQSPRTKKSTARSSVSPTSDNREDKHGHGGMESSKEGESSLAFCRLLVRRPKTAFGIALGAHLVITVVTVLLMVLGVNVVEINFGVVPLELLDHASYLRFLAWDNRDEDGTVVGKDTRASTIGERSRLADSLVLIYQGGDSSVFTKERLSAMQQLEDRLMNASNYTDFCRLPQSEPNSTLPPCIVPMSILRFFDGTYGPMLNDSTFSNIPATLNMVNNVGGLLRQQLQFHLDADAVITSTEVRSSITRSLFQFGFPMEDHDLKADDKEKQLLNIRQFQVDSLNNILTETLDSGVGDMDFLYFSRQLFVHDLLQQVVWDMLLAVGSLLFIFLFVLFMTKSLFITCFGILSIISSFVIATLLYRIVFQYKYFGVFHVLSIFIILGIGADNIFVFVDNWRATAHQGYTCLETRLSACYWRAATATFCTSLTTMVAFFSNALSPLLAVQSFGLFSGILVFVNYMSVILFFPTALIVYHYHWDTYTWPCFRKKTKDDTAPPDGEAPHPIVRFFRGPFYNLVSHRVLRWALILLCLALVVLFSVFVAKLKPDEESIKFFKDSHHFGKALLLNRDGFKPSSEDEVIKVYMVWGLKEQDLSRCQKTDIKCKGVTVWDDGFDLNPKRSQSALLDFCEELQNLSGAQASKLHIRHDHITNKNEVQCFLQHINTFMEAEGNKSQYPKGSSDLTLPTSDSKVAALVLNNPGVYNVTSLNPLLYRQFETVMGYWLYNGYLGNRSNDYTVYSSLLGEGVDTYDTRLTALEPKQNWGTRLVYAAIAVNTTLKVGTLGYSTGIPIVEAWEDFFQGQISHMPSSLAGGFQCTPESDNPWHTFYVQKKLTDTAVQGIALGLSLAFVVITLATKNIITGFLATLDIGFVTLMVVGLIPMAGWKLGVLESLNLSLVVGLSVDYVVHLADGYHASSAPDRLTRTRDMLEHVGISILSGAVTTLGAAVFMIGAVILFFMQFGIFMFATIGFSLFHALLGFSVLMALLGPEKQTGSLAPVFRWLRYKLRGRKSHHVMCKQCEGKGFHDKTRRDNSSASTLR